MDQQCCLVRYGDRRATGVSPPARLGGRAEPGRAEMLDPKHRVRDNEYALEAEANMAGTQRTDGLRTSFSNAAGSGFGRELGADSTYHHASPCVTMRHYA